MSPLPGAHSQFSTSTAIISDEEKESPLSKQLAAAHNNPWDRRNNETDDRNNSNATKSRPRSPPPHQAKKKKRRASMPMISNLPLIREILVSGRNMASTRNNMNGSSNSDRILHPFSSIVSDFDSDLRRRKRVMNFDDNEIFNLRDSTELTMTPLNDEDENINDSNSDVKQNENETNENENESNEKDSKQSNTKTKQKPNSDRMWHLHTLNMKLQHEVKKL